MLVANMVVGMVGGVPMFLGIARNMAAFADRHPDRTTVTSGPGYYSMQIDGPVPPELMLEPMRWFVPALAIGTLLPFLATGTIAFWLIFDPFSQPGVAPDMAPFLLLFGNNMAYLVALVILVIQLCRPGDPGSNRFGPPLD